MTRDFERFADRADAAVHHVARRDDVGAGLGMRQRLLDQRIDGDVVHDVAGIVDDAVLAVRRVRVERDVGDHAELRHGLLDRAHCALREPFGIPGFAAVEALDVARRHREQRQRRDAQLGERLGLAHQLIDRDPLDAGHALDRLAPRAALDDEHRIDEIVGAERALAHQPAREFVAAHAAHASAREFACLSVGHRKAVGSRL